MKSLWESVVVWFVRWRTWAVNLFASALLVLPELLNAPEILAIVPLGYQKYVFVAALLLNIWMRPRAAVTKADLGK